MASKCFTCKTCGVEFTSKYYTPRTYCSKSCKNKDPELIKASNKKRSITNKNKYGGHPMSLPSVQSKHKKTMLNKYNAPHPLQNQQLKDKVFKTKLQTYGDGCYNNYEKAKETKLQRYGTLNTSLAGYHKSLREAKLNWDGIKILDDIYTVDLTSPVLIQCTQCQRKWKVSLDNNYRPSCRYCSQKYTKVSKGHQEIVDYIASLDSSIQIKVNDRSVLGGDELDIYLPEFKLAIEFNGVYYHSSKFKHSSYHLDKTRACLWKGITLLHILELDWKYNSKIIKSMLQSKLGFLSKSIYARKCKVLEVSSNLKKSFLVENHIQGNARSSINIGLYYDTELVGIMTIGKSRFDSEYQYELIRYAVKAGYHVTGGFSKALSYFCKTYSPTSIVSYAKRDYSTGKVYISNNFTFVGFTKPGYSYIKDSNIYPRQKFQKHKLPNIFSEVDMSLSEKQIMENHNYYRLYDSGNLKFIKTFE